MLAIAGCSRIKKPAAAGSTHVDAPSVDLDMVSVDDCHFYDVARLDSYISLGEAECVKKALMEGADGNGTHYDSFFNTKKTYLELALESSSQFFSQHRRYSPATIVALLLNHGGDANRKFDDGTTFLERSLRLPAASETVTLYVVHFAATNVNLASRGGLPLEIALAEKRENLVQALLKRSANPNLFSSGSVSLTHQALGADLFLATLALLSAGADPNAQNFAGISLVQRSIDKERREVFDSLVGKGASLAKAAESGETPLMAATKAADGYFFEKVLAAKVDGNAIDGDGRSALYFAVAENRSDRARVLLDYHASVQGKTKTEGATLLHVATDLTLAKEIIDRGLAIDSKDRRGQTPLSLAVCNSRAAFVEEFLARNADRHWRDPSGRTLLHLAVASNSLETVTLLFTAGLEVDAKDNAGQSPLAEVSSVAMFDRLVQKGADPLARDNAGFHTFTHVYRRAPLHLELLGRFVAEGASPDADVTLGFYPLHYATSYTVSGSEKERAALLALLMKAGAQVDRRDRNGDGAIHSVRSLEGLQVFRANGADLALIDAEGDSLRQKFNKYARELELRLASIRRIGSAKEIREAEAAFAAPLRQFRTLEAYLLQEGA